MSKKRPRLTGMFNKFLRDIVSHTPFVKLVLLLISLWLLFSKGLYLGERGVEGMAITS